MISFPSQASKSTLCPPYQPAKGDNVDIGSDFIKLPERKIDSYITLTGCTIFPDIKKQFLEDVDELKKLANFYIDKQYDNAINMFRDNIKYPPNCIRDHLLPIYRETRFHIHQIVAIINECKRLELVSHNHKSYLAPTASVPFSKDGIAYILHDCLIGIDLCLDGVRSRFMGSYFGLMAAGDGLQGKLFEVRSGLLCHFIQSFLFHQKQEGVIKVFEGMEVHWFNSLHNLACEQLVLESIEDRFAPRNLSDKVTGRFLSGLTFAINEYTILRKLSDKLFGQLSSDLEAVGLSGWLKASCSVEDITGAQITELESRFVKPANLLLNAKDDDHKLDIWTIFEANDDDTYQIDRCREKLMAWATRTLLSADATVFTALPQQNERKQLFIGTMNHLFFWVFGSDKLLSSGDVCSFDRNNHISLQLCHLKSINHSHLSMNTRFGLLTQAMEQTHQADDITDFFLDSHICEQLNTIELQVIEAMENLLIEKALHCGGLRENLVTNVCEYFKPSHQEPSQPLQPKDAVWFINTPLLVNTQLLEPVLLCLKSRNVDISLITKTLPTCRISDFTKEGINELFSLKRMQSLFQEARKLDQCSFIIKLLLTGSCDNQINKLDKRKKTLLIRLSEQGLTDGVIYLLKKTESNVNHKDADGWTALIAAARYGHKEIVRLLLECEDILINEKNKYGVTALFAAARHGHEEIVRLLLECEDILLNEKNKYGWTALIVATRYGHEKIVRLLLECEDILLNEKNKEGWTALILAARYGHEEIVQLLLDCESVLFNGKTEFRWTALIAAACYGHYKIVRLLLECEGILLNKKDNYGRTALMLATGYGNLQVVRMLLEREDILLNENNNQGWTALFTSAYYGHVEIVRLLLKCEGILLNEKNNYGYTALAVAAHNGCSGCVRLLVEHPAVGVNISNRLRSTPLLLAAGNGHKKCVEILLNDCNVNLNKVNYFMRTALSQARKNHHTEIVNMLWRDRRLVKNPDRWQRFRNYSTTPTYHVL